MCPVAYSINSSLPYKELARVNKRNRSIATRNLAPSNPKSKKSTPKSPNSKKKRPTPRTRGTKSKIKHSTRSARKSTSTISASTKNNKVVSPKKTPLKETLSLDRSQTSKVNLHSRKNDSRRRTIDSRNSLRG